MSDMFKSQTNWMVNNKTANNIVFVTTAGDMVNTSSSTTEYGNADSAIDILDAGGVWYTVAPGNHDNPGYSGTASLSQLLWRLTLRKPPVVANGGWFGGSYDDYNTYSLFSASRDGLHPDQPAVSVPPLPYFNWADALLKTYSNRRAIVEQHDILNVNNSWNNQASYNALRDHTNLFLMLCGHMHIRFDGAAYVAGTGTAELGTPFTLCRQTTRT